MLISYIRFKLLIAAVAVSVSFTGQIHSMENKPVNCTPNNDWSSTLSDDDSASSDHGNKLARELFSDDLMTQMHEDFLQAVYNQNNFAVEQLICRPALEYLKTHFRAPDNEVEQIQAWAKKNNYTALCKSIARAIEQEKPENDFWGDWGF